MAVNTLLLFLAAIVAFWISAICGGGASLVLVPLLSALLPGSVVPLSLTIGTFTSSAARLVVFKKQIHWKIVLWFVPFSTPAVLLGAWLIKYIDPLYLQALVGLFLLANVPELLKSKTTQRTNEKPYPKGVLALVGVFAGFVSGITGAIGLLFNRFYLNYGLTKEEIVATRAANEIILHAIKLIIYLALGLYSGPALWLGLAIAAASVLSSVTVKFILPYISEFVFRKIGYGAMVVSGLVLLIGTTQSILQQDHISFSTNRYNERTLHWRNSEFVLEFAIDDGLEIERPINFDELPNHLKTEYSTLKAGYNTILLEKVFKLGEEPSYEFYCFKGGQLTKLEFEE